MVQVAGSNDFIAQRYTKNYISGMVVSVASTTTLSFTSGGCRCSQDENNIDLPIANTLNFGVVGLNGIDTGVIGASKSYYLFAVGDSLDPLGLVNATGVIASLSATPVLPVGADGKVYDMFRRIGWARTGAGSTLLTLNVSGQGGVRDYWYDTMIAVLTNGAAQTLTAIDLSVACPPVANMEWTAHVEFTPATAGDTVKFAPFGSTATVIPGISGAVAAIKQTEQIKLLSKLDSGVPKTLYINSAAVCDSDIWCAGFSDVL